jgi:nuclear GTP-binding protein
MVHKKSGSHRRSLHDKYKIIKKVKEHRRKMNKLARKNPEMQKKLKKDPGIPNLWPYKEKLIKQAEKRIEQEEDMRIHLRTKRQAAVDRARTQVHNVDTKEQDTPFASEKEKDFVQRRWYFRELNKVLDKADVILEVVDARDPMGCRCIEIEKRIQGLADNSKKLVLVINKIDLIPPDVAQKWVSFFRREYPTVAFKSSTQQQNSNLGRTNIKLSKMSETNILTGSSIGAGALMSLLKNYARSQNVKKTIVVGVIGYPNVGKSSIINSLKRSKAANVSANPGCTKTLQTIKLDHHISLIDSPGVLFAAGESQADLVLRNCVKVEQMEDPISAVVDLVSKVPSESLMEVYRIATFSSPQEFISHVAHKRGKLKAGGVPNLAAAATSILKDWTNGVIPFYTLPPQNPNVEHESKVIVGGWGAEVDEVLDSHQVELQGMTPAEAMRSFFVKEASKPLPLDLSGDTDATMDSALEQPNDEDEDEGEDEGDEGDAELADED